ncbi:MAG TPA: c-type cytochrome [Bryobacteraceae bacterium]|nr:c-type cytochrome [Bryobacteraceae bacterium]
MKKILGLTMGIIAAVGDCSGQTAVSKTAGEVYKNVVVLRDTPQSEWTATMSFMSGSLGVTCSYCHAQQYDSDAKAAKVTARAMIRMVHQINATNFGGKQVVTCNTCHQGATHPNGVPGLWNKTPEQLAAFKAASAPKAAAKVSESLPSADQILDQYRKAVGSDQVKSVHVVGTLSSDLTPARSFEGYAVFPDRLVITLSLSGAQNKMLINGDRVWGISPAGASELSSTQAIQVRKSMMDLFQPLKFINVNDRHEVVGSETVGGRKCFVVQASGDSHVDRMYFDSQTGLLAKFRNERHTALGVEPSELVLDDYRELGGVKVPFSVTIYSLTDRVLYRLSEFGVNAAVDEGMFAVPAVSGGK